MGFLGQPSATYVPCTSPIAANNRDEDTDHGDDGEDEDDRDYEDNEDDEDKYWDGYAAGQVTEGAIVLIDGKSFQLGKSLFRQHSVDHGLLKLILNSETEPEPRGEGTSAVAHHRVRNASPTNGDHLWRRLEASICPDSLMWVFPSPSV